MREEKHASTQLPSPTLLDHLSSPPSPELLAPLYFEVMADSIMAVCEMTEVRMYTAHA